MKVTTTIQSPPNAPVEMTWCKDGNEVDVLMSVAQILRHAQDAVQGVETLAITIEL